jgi:hypothetical protein
MIKTYLVPITDELIKAMEKGEAPSFLHCATCLDDLTNGEVFKKVFQNIPIEVGFNEKHGIVSFYHNGENNNRFNLDWWNKKWGE